MDSVYLIANKKMKGRKWKNFKKPKYFINFNYLKIHGTYIVPLKILLRYKISQKKKQKTNDMNIYNKLILTFL